MLLSSGLDDGLARGAPSGSGVDSAAIEAFLNDVEAAGLEMHSLMLHRNGKVVAEAFRWPYRPEQIRIMHSLAKSVTACAVGLAIDEGLVRLTDRVVSFFPEHVPAEADAKLAAMTVEDLLTMRTGHAQEVGGPLWRSIDTSWIAEFFRLPIVHEPGTTYVYSSSSSYMLAAILAKVTGQSLHEYLKPRLFEPLGVHGETWDVGPDGFNPGGNGLTCTTADILKFGILHAQNGVWEGRRLLSEDWIAASTRLRVRHDEGGYGYHWVAYDNGAYSALGIFVQMVMVFPQAGATLAFTGAIDGSKLLTPILERHFPAAFRPAPFENAAADARLKARLEGLAKAIPTLVSAPSSLPTRISGQVFRADSNPLGVTAVAFEFGFDRVTFRLDDAEGAHAVVAGLDRWIEGRTDMPGRELHHGYKLVDAPVVAGARWIDGATLETTWIFSGTAFRDTVTCRFDGDRVVIDRAVNINSGARAWPTITATKEG